MWTSTTAGEGWAGMRKVGERVGVVGFAKDRPASAREPACVAHSQERPPASKHAGAPTAMFICLCSNSMSKLKKIYIYKK